jgi:hypothetical protein
MALLSYTYKEKAYNYDLSLEKGLCTCLNIDEDHRWNFTQHEDIQECLAQIIRAENGFYALIAARQKNVNVNDVCVFGLHILRNTDRVLTEQEELRFYEWIRQRVASNSRLLGTSCPFCTIPFQVGDPVIHCPKCDTPMHESCWVSRKGVDEGCILPNCGYMPPEGDPYVPLIQE